MGDFFFSIAITPFTFIFYLRHIIPLSNSMNNVLKIIHEQYLCITSLSSLPLLLVYVNTSYIIAYYFLPPKYCRAFIIANLQRLASHFGNVMQQQTYPACFRYSVISDIGLPFHSYEQFGLQPCFICIVIVKSSNASAPADFFLGHRPQNML